jgi:hypothetical protein
MVTPGALVALPEAALVAPEGSPPEPRSQPMADATTKAAIHARRCGAALVNMLRRAYTKEQCRRLAASKAPASWASNLP